MRVFGTIGRERMRISAKYIDSELLDEKSAQIMRAWHTDGAAVELAKYIARLKWSGLPQIVAQASRYNQAWRGELARSLSRKLVPSYIRERLLR
jgi:hypothetical protein